MTSDELVALIRKYRDWRIDASDPLKSMVFMPGAGADAYPVPAPVSAASTLGRHLWPVFEVMAQAINDYLAEWKGKVTQSRRASDDQLRSMDLPSAFAVVALGVRLRIQPVRRLKGYWFHVRVPQTLLSLDELGMPHHLRALLSSQKLDGGGLVAVCGTFGSGKTTTVHAAIRARLAERGGFAMLLGNPVEFDLAGYHGTHGRPSYIEQIDLAGLNLSTEIEASMRNFPSGSNNILAFPELISSDGAGEMLRMSNRGNLVFADMHANNLEAMILNLISMGLKDGEAQSRELLANSLRLIVHQHMSPSATPGAVVVTFTSVVIPRGLRSALADASQPIGRVLIGLKDAPKMAAHAE